MPTIFSRIIAGEIPCFKVAENDRCLAFLDIRPIALGHTLVIPKTEIDYIFDMDDAHLADLHIFSKKVAAVLRQEIDCLRIGVMIAGLEVPHAHIHLVPIRAVSDLSFNNPRPTIAEDEMSALSNRLLKTFSSQYGTV
jgi:histidine triad (HIT) family protein